MRVRSERPNHHAGQLPIQEDLRRHADPHEHRHMSELTYHAVRWLKCSSAPNNTLQRTRSAPLRSPLSFKANR